MNSLRAKPYLKIKLFLYLFGRPCPLLKLYVCVMEPGPFLIQVKVALGRTMTPDLCTVIFPTQV